MRLDWLVQYEVVGVALFNGHKRVVMLCEREREQRGEVKHFLGELSIPSPSPHDAQINKMHMWTDTSFQFRNMKSLLGRGGGVGDWSAFVHTSEISFPPAPGVANIFSIE